MEFTYSLPGLKQAVDQVYQASNGKKIWAFYADMGAGKTTFIHALCEQLGVTSAISSPTYAIINEYKSEGKGVIYHMDWYRLRDEEEALQAGVEDTLLSGRLCLVEWPERAEGLLPEDCFKINIKVIDEQTRCISIL